MIKLFKSLIALQIFSIIVLFISSNLYGYGNYPEMAFFWIGTNSLIDYYYISALFQIIYALYIAAYIGLVFFQNWARVLLIFAAVIWGILTSISGLAVFTPFEVTTSFYMNIIDGMIISFSFFTSLNYKFSKRKENLVT
ncbi:hypothetical protein [Nitrincola sp. MINF-07-Sa-05]|uniref:hypothetical protein n=1 Tax=Nitrincola salilacus TaxID=3400273 RepID=UPI003918262B